MKRFLLIALAIVLPLALFAFAKSAASWRPVPVAATESTFAFWTSRMRVAREAVLVADISSGAARPTRFDLATGKSGVSGGEGFTLNGARGWKWIKTSPPQIALDSSHGAEVYPVPAGIPVVSPFNAQVFDDAESVGFLSFDRYLRWNKRSRLLERDLDLDGTNWQNMALTSDGAAIVSATPARILVYSARDGRVIKRINATDASAELYQPMWISARGDFAGYETSSHKSSTRRCDIWDVRRARKAWSFERELSGLTVLSPDEKLLAQADAAAGIWQIYQLKNGARVHQLPLLGGIVAAAFSPDGATLYSAVNAPNRSAKSGANGTLYRQRAR